MATMTIKDAIVVHDARAKAQQWYMRVESGEAIRKANGIGDP